MKVAVVLGTRPEAIKMAPVIRALGELDSVDVQVWSTGQHQEMLTEMLSLFDIRVDVDLKVMAPNQGLNGLFARVLAGMDEALARETPDRVLVQGDTTTAAAAALAAFHRGIPVGHVEAGLRSGNMHHPWPEEMNRRMVDVIADQLYAPTEQARANLLAENLGDKQIFVTGNTVIDAVMATAARLELDAALKAEMEARFSFLSATRRLVLVTCHRRENFGDRFAVICDAIAEIGALDDVEVVFPVHLNPNIQARAYEVLNHRPYVHLLAPLDYPGFIYLSKRARVIVTDSGGVQEESSALGRHVLVMRDVTERSEAKMGGLRMVGADKNRIMQGVISALAAKSPQPSNVFGDGTAGVQIAKLATGFA